MTDIGQNKPVVGLSINGETAVYLVRILIWHKIVNDTVAGAPFIITFCPLCNASTVFERWLDGKVLDFGTTGKLRKSDLVMWNRQTESWRQQLLSECIVGEITSKALKIWKPKIESKAIFKTRAPQTKVLIPTNDGMRKYGSNPYMSYDWLRRLFLYNGEMPKGGTPVRPCGFISQ